MGGTNLCSYEPRVRFFNTQHNLDVLALFDGRYKFLLERETGAARLFELAGNGRWKKTDPIAHREREEHYEELVTAWYRYLTE